MSLFVRSVFPKNDLPAIAARIRPWVVLSVFLIAGFLLRIAGIQHTALWYDELLSLHRAGLPFWEHMAQNLNLWELVLRLFADPARLRWPAIFSSMLSLWLAWRIMILLRFDQAQRIAGMLTLICLPGLLWIAQDARYYSGVALIYMASIYFALERRWLGLFAMSGLSIYIHPTAPAYIVPAWLLVLRSTPRHVLAGSLLLIPIWSLRVITLGGVHNPNFWAGRADFPGHLALFGFAIGAAPDNAAPALLLTALALAFAALRFRPATWVIFSTPLAVIIAVTALIQPVTTYRTVQPSLMGLGLLIGSAMPRGRLAWLYFPLLVLLVVMVARYDPSLRGGHMDQIAARVREAWRPGDCIQYGDDFSRVTAGYYLKDLPDCQGQDRSWLIERGDKARVEFARTDGWHFEPIRIYAPKEPVLPKRKDVGYNVPPWVHPDPVTKTKERSGPGGP